MTAAQLLITMMGSFTVGEAIIAVLLAVVILKIRKKS